MTMNITISQFKAHCLGIVERVQREKLRVTISRYGRPAALLLPVPPDGADAPLFARGAETTKISGDLMQTDEEWDAGH